MRVGLTLSSIVFIVSPLILGDSTAGFLSLPIPEGKAREQAGESPHLSDSSNGVVAAPGCRVVLGETSRCSEGDGDGAPWSGSGNIQGERMSHYAYQKGQPALDLEVDVIVVGSGAGGSVVAYDLALGGLQVALVEAGPWRDPEDYPESMYGTMRDMMDSWGALFAEGGRFCRLYRPG